MTAPLSADLGALFFDSSALGVMTLVGASLIRSERTITRFEAGLRHVLDVAYTTATLLRG